MSNESFTEQATERLARLRQRCADPGFRAALRHWLSDAGRPRAYQALMELRGTLDDEDFNTIAALYAYHPEHSSSTGGLGATLHRLAKPKRDQNGGITFEHKTFEARLKRLLFCDREELRDRLMPVVLAARNDDRTPLNYSRLMEDLHYWGERVRQAWAQDFWGQPETAPAKPEEVPS
ncbi:MAG: type I-E CRISPR-associated protein Cse2/CasB [Limisphaerales bacterium]